MRALVLGGGGARGAWQVGVLRYLYLVEAQKYDIISGSSVGALNGAFLAQYDKGTELEAYADLEKMWFSLSDRKIYRKWYRGVFGRIPALWKPSPYTNAPLRKLATKTLDPGRMDGHLFSLGATDLLTGTYVSWNNTEEDFKENLVKYIMASSSVPGYFPPENIHGDDYVDAGVRELVPVKDAIKLGATKLDIVIPAFQQMADSSPKTTLQVVLRAISIMMHEIDVNDINIPSAEDLEIRIIRPFSDIFDSSLDFDPDHVKHNIHAGYSDAVRLWLKSP